MDVNQLAKIKSQVLLLVFPYESEYDEKQVALVEQIIKMGNSRLVQHLSPIYPKNHRLEEKKVPVELEYILVEASVARYNYLASEGMQSESVEGHSAVYFDPFVKYMDDINRYILEVTEALDGPRRGRWKFV